MRKGLLSAVCTVAATMLYQAGCAGRAPAGRAEKPSAPDAEGPSGPMSDGREETRPPVRTPEKPPENKRGGPSDRPHEAEGVPPTATRPDPRLAHRWFFSFGYGRNRKDVDRIKSLVETAAAHGLNGMVLSSFGLDGVTRWRREDFAFLAEVRAFCAERNVELVPTGFSVGYGGGALGHDRSFAAALPVSITLVAEGGRAFPAASEENLLGNGDLEEHENGRFRRFAFHDQPGEVSFPDTEFASSGRTSARFENLIANEHGHGRIMQKVSVRPGHSYRFSCMMKTQDLRPVSGLQLLVLRESGTIASVRPKLQATQDWTEIALDFINFAESEVRVYAGIWGGKSGRFWIDDIRLREHGSLADIVRREGAPLELRSEDGTVKFTEGKDFQEIGNRRDLRQIALTPGTGIKEGDRLVLSCYKAPYVGHSWGHQVSLCMSNPALYEYWEAQARKLHEVLGFKKFLLSMDEIRNGGGCLLCRNSGLSMAEILGGCITRQSAIFKSIDPEIEVLIWSDMLDPNHNAHDNYYGVVGDFAGSWRHVPGDLVIACWQHKIRDKSLGFFSGHGFRTLGAAYYDSDNLDGCAEWLASLENTKDATGIMYTSWRRKYELLGPFGDLVSGE